MGALNDLTPAEIDHRNKAFDEWLRRNGAAMGYYLLPANRQAQVRGLLRKAFNAGTNYEAKMSRAVAHSTTH